MTVTLKWPRIVVEIYQGEGIAVSQEERERERERGALCFRQYAWQSFFTYALPNQFMGHDTAYIRIVQLCSRSFPPPTQR